MTKKDLKNGMIVETREGTRYLYCEGVMRGLNAWDLISNYTDDLKYPEFPLLDIVKVFKYGDLKPIWQRPEIPKLIEKKKGEGMTKKQGWIIYGIGIVLTFALDFILFVLLFPKLMFAMAGVIEILWLIGWLCYMSYRFDI